MTLDTLLQKLTLKFPSYLKNDSTELMDIEDALKGYDPNDLDLVWNEFRDTYTFSTAPRRAIFVKIASLLNIRRSRGDAPKYEWVCHNCNANSQPCKFPVDQWPCPRCGCRFQPWIATGRVGCYVDRNTSQGVLNMNPQGRHPTLGITESIHNPRMGKILDKIMGGRS